MSRRRGLLPAKRKSIYSSVCKTPQGMKTADDADGEEIEDHEEGAKIETHLMSIRKVCGQVVKSQPS